MKPQDQSIANLATAVTGVLFPESKNTKETKVQDADKDFVDLHSIDKKQREGTEPLTEKDIEEANEFTKAAAKAAVAGDKDFEFDGETFPTQMDVDVAKKILGESSKNQLLVKDLEKLIKNPDPSRVKQYGGTKYVDMLKSKLAKLQEGTLSEAKMSLGAKTAQKQIYSLEASLKVGSNLNKGVNKSLGGKYDADFKNMEKAISEIHGIWEDIEYDYKNLGFSKQVGESIEEASIDVDTADPKSREFEKLLKKYKVKAKIITMKGPGGGMPLVKLSGKKKDLEGILKDPMGWQDDGFLAGFIEESNGFEPLVNEELTPYIFGDGEASVDEAVNSLDRKKAARNGANFKWEDINKALMSVGMSPPNILKVSSALRGKEQ